MEDLDCFGPKEGCILFLEVTVQKLFVLNSPDFLKVIWCNYNDAQKNGCKGMSLSETSFVLASILGFMWKL